MGTFSKLQVTNRRAEEVADKAGHPWHARNTVPTVRTHVLRLQQNADRILSLERMKSLNHRHVTRARHMTTRLATLSPSIS